MPNEKIYTSEDFIEHEKIHASNYKEIHNLTRDTFDKCTDPIIRKCLINIMNYTYDKEVISQKDIIIEASQSVETKDTSN